MSTSWAASGSEMMKHNYYVLFLALFCLAIDVIVTITKVLLLYLLLLLLLPRLTVRQSTLLYTTTPEGTPPSLYFFINLKLILQLGREKRRKGDAAAPLSYSRGWKWQGTHSEFCSIRNFGASVSRGGASVWCSSLVCCKSARRNEGRRER